MALIDRIVVPCIDYSKTGYSIYYSDDDASTFSSYSNPSSWNDGTRDYYIGNSSQSGFPSPGNSGFFVANNRIFAALQNGIAYNAISTSDDGKTWSNFDASFGSPYDGVGGVAADSTGSVFGMLLDTAADYYIIKDSDGGASWSSPSACSVTQSSTACILRHDGSSRYLMASGKRIYTSDDGGSTWTLRIATGTSRIMGLAGDGSNNWYLINDSFQFWKSTDNGSNWSYAGYNAYSYSIEWDSTNSLYVVCGGNTSGAKIWTTTNGASFTDVSPSSSYNQAIRNVAVKDGKWCGTTRDDVIFTDDGGSSYTYYTPGISWSHTFDGLGEPVFIETQDGDFNIIGSPETITYSANSGWVTLASNPNPATISAAETITLTANTGFAGLFPVELLIDAPETITYAASSGFSQYQTLLQDEPNHELLYFTGNYSGWSTLIEQYNTIVLPAAIGSAANVPYCYAHNDIPSALTIGFTANNPTYRDPWSLPNSESLSYAATTYWRTGFTIDSNATRVYRALLGDLTLSVSSIQIRWAGQYRGYISITVPGGLSLIDEITARESDTLIVYAGAKDVMSGLTSWQAIGASTLTDVRTDSGPSSNALTLVGATAAELYDGTSQFVLTGIRSKRKSNGVVTFNADIDFFIRPGDIATYSSTSIDVDSVQYIINASQEYMVVSGVEF